MNKSRFAKTLLRTVTAGLGAVLSVGLLLGATGASTDPVAGVQVEAAGEYNAAIDQQIDMMRANGVSEVTISVYLNRLISAGVYSPPVMATTCVIKEDGTKICRGTPGGRAWGGR